MGGEQKNRPLRPAAGCGSAAGARGKGSESHGLQAEARVLLEAEHEVHVLHGLARSALEQVVDAGRDEELVGMALSTGTLEVSIVNA